MSVSWSARADDERDLPDHAGNFPVIALGFDPAGGIVTVRLAREALPFAAPECVQDDDVIEPTSIFKPWVPSKYWDIAEENE